MAKKGGSRHNKRITAPKSSPIKNRKHEVWAVSKNPGAHPKKRSMTITTLLRDVLGICADAKEVRRVIAAKEIKVDGKVIEDARRVVGIMDIIELVSMKKAYRIQIIDKKLSAKKIKMEQTKDKICKVIGKRTEKKKKVYLTTHDGRTVPADNQIKVGSTIIINLTDSKIIKVNELKEGAECIVIDGKHKGEIATLKTITKREGSMPARAVLKTKNNEFTTIIDYLIVLDEKFE